MLCARARRTNRSDHPAIPPLSRDALTAAAPEPKRKGQVCARERARQCEMNRPVPSLAGKTRADGEIDVVTPIPHQRRSCPSVKGQVALGTVERRHQQDDLSLGTAPSLRPSRPGRVSRESPPSGPEPGQAASQVDDPSGSVAPDAAQLISGSIPLAIETVTWPILSRSAFKTECCAVPALPGLRLNTCSITGFIENPLVRDGDRDLRHRSRGVTKGRSACADTADAVGNINRSTHDHPGDVRVAGGLSRAALCGLTALAHAAFATAGHPGERGVLAIRAQRRAVVSRALFSRPALVRRPVTEPSLLLGAGCERLVGRAMTAAADEQRKSARERSLLALLPQLSKTRSGVPRLPSCTRMNGRGHPNGWSPVRERRRGT
jgi:hypothetical protein